MASKHPLRRSCAFCRARKIRCSNETICEACRRQGADCIYDFEPSRPKARSHDGRSPCSASPRGSPAGDGCVEEADSVARLLERSFVDNFGHDHGRRRHGTSSYGPVKYTGMLALLAQDLIGLASDRLGTLGSHHVQEGRGRVFRTELAGDETAAMFDHDDEESGGNPLGEYGQRQQTQLIDVWFSMHPLSFVVSKTLLLRELRDGTHDEVLLATMLADANLSIGDENAILRARCLLRWATGQLRTRRPTPGSWPAPHHGSGAGGASTRVFGGISTAQALMLLGWNALCSGRTRRAACHLGLAARIAGEIRDQMAGASASTSSRINGIDVSDVEREVVAYLYWTTFSLGLWASLQTGHRLLLASLTSSSTLTPVLLPVTETSSVMIKLDLISENFSTLQKQKAVLREMWPLAHIASIVAHVTTDADDVHRLVADKMQALGRQQGVDVSSRSLVLVAYHALALHSLFPQPSSAADRLVLERFCDSAQDLVRIFDAVVGEQPHHLSAVRSSLADVFCLALDACARALRVIDAMLLLGDGPLVAQQAWEGRLLALARSLLDVTEDDFLNQGRSLRMVRKSLKAFVRGLGGGAGPGSASSASSGFPSPPRGCSLPHTPMHSPVSAAIAVPATVGSDSASLVPSSSSPLNTPSTSSVFDDGCKSDWPAPEYYTVSDFDQNTWLSQIPASMDLDMDLDMDLVASAPPLVATGLPWDWPAVTGIDATTTIPPANSDMDSVLFYFENGHNKRPC
ncbi:protein kinase subdomain-containing protein [Ophiocordyceps camponoti-floridani]|uniref:Protein kinase subdomain-containing protein n=1 Tax=Ophiocordyceps camponoti-floridani TaxID=2030778 RepID=A0A8H4QCX3_9HYPO|nr:protein kinase subdomain-containing protein [Ophiocordyceps camponoti-floridani]